MGQNAAHFVPSLIVKLQMETKDIITLLISGAALAVSLISLYFSLWYKKVSLVGCLAAWDSATNKNALLSNCEITLSNTGNQELLLREVIVEIVGDIEGELTPVIETEKIPMVIKPGAVILLTLPIPKLFMNKLIKNNSRMKLEFHLFTPKAELQIASKILTPFHENEIRNEDWEPFNLGKSKM